MFKFFGSRWYRLFRMYKQSRSRGSALRAIHNLMFNDIIVLIWGYLQVLPWNPPIQFRWIGFLLTHFTSLMGLKRMTINSGAGCYYMGASNPRSPFPMTLCPVSRIGGRTLMAMAAFFVKHKMKGKMAPYFCSDSSWPLNAPIAP